MIQLLRLYWKLIQHPNATLEENIRHWPVWLGVVLFFFSDALLYVSNAKISEFSLRAASIGYGTSTMESTCLALIIVWTLGSMMYYFLYPHFVAAINRVPVESIDASLLRRIMFYAPTAYVIVTIVIQLPLILLLVISLSAGSYGKVQLAITWLYAISVLLASGAILNQYILTWKGLQKYFALKPFSIIFLVFILPMILNLPLLIGSWSEIVRAFESNNR